MNRPSGMLTILLGSAFGVILTLAGLGIVTAARSPDDATLAQPAGLTSGLAPGTREMLVGCEPSQVAIFRTNAAGIESVQCVSTGYNLAPAVAPMAPAMSVAPVRTVSAPVAASPAPVRRASESRSGRSWQKTAMVIGGSTATGAGVGGLIGGKKGALIGAAIGGGASTIYEAGKR